MGTKIPTSTLALVQSKLGDPEKVLRFSRVALPPWKENSVFFKFLASPINPSDINAIQGVYPIPSAKAEAEDLLLPGFEGVARVTAVGKHVKHLQPGDWVLPSSSGIGTWRSSAICSDDKLFKVPNTVAMKSASMISINPPSALRMLTDFGPLKSGSTIVQNAANSAVGQAVIQIAKLRGIQTINMIRDRNDFEEVKKYLMGLGADHVLKEGDLIPFLKDNGKKVQLALNAVGGESSYDLARSLSYGGTMVTYGGMSKKPLTAPTGALIFKNIQLKGFWMAQWKKEHSKDEVLAMYNELFEMVVQDKLKMPPTEEIPFEKAAQDPNWLRVALQPSDIERSQNQVPSCVS